MNNCDGSHCIQPAGEVRLLPMPGFGSNHGNLILCRTCHRHEIDWRRERNKDLGLDAQYPLPTWESLEIAT